MVCEGILDLSCVKPEPIVQDSQQMKELLRLMQGSEIFKLLLPRKSKLLNTELVERPVYHPAKFSLNVIKDKYVRYVGDEYMGFMNGDIVDAVL